jgi:DNA replication protein DnaC
LTAYKYKADEYNDYFGKLAGAEVLYIDDLLKFCNLSDKESMKILYKLINTRYNNQSQTIISSEFYLRDLFIADNATGGRIKELAEKYVIEIPRDNKLNHRL